MLVSTDQHATPTRRYQHPTTTYRYHQALSTSTSTDCKLRQTGLSACTQMATRTLCWLWHAWPLPKCPSRAHHSHCQSALPGPKMDACLLRLATKHGCVVGVFACGQENISTCQPQPQQLTHWMEVVCMHHTLRAGTIPAAPGNTERTKHMHAVIDTSTLAPCTPASTTCNHTHQTSILAGTASNLAPDGPALPTAHTNQSDCQRCCSTCTGDATTPRSSPGKP